MLRAHRRAARLAVHSAAVAATEAAPRARDVEALVADARTTLRLWGLDAEAVDLEQRARAARAAAPRTPGDVACGSADCGATCAGAAGAYCVDDALWYCGDCWAAYAAAAPDHWADAFGDETAPL